jgi:hypothetical protein
MISKTTTIQTEFQDHMLNTSTIRNQQFTTQNTITKKLMLPTTLLSQSSITARNTTKNIAPLHKQQSTHTTTVILLHHQKKNGEITTKFQSNSTNH